MCVHTAWDSPRGGSDHEMSVGCGPLVDTWGEGSFPSCLLVAGFLFLPLGPDPCIRGLFPFAGWMQKEQAKMAGSCRTAGEDAG